VPPPVSIVTSLPSLDCDDITTEAKATSSSSMKPDGLYLPLSLTLSLRISMMFYSLISNTRDETPLIHILDDLKNVTMVSRAKLLVCDLDRGKEKKERI
jgi:hypothetical protein